MRSSTYPTGSIILLAMTFFEAGAFSIFLILNPTYWRESVGVSEKIASDANFFYGFLLNFTPLVTAFLADNYWGRYAVLGLHSVCFIIGFLFVLASTVVSFPFSAIFGTISLLLVSIAVGINKVILPTFNADQFQGHTDETRNKMFSWYYIAVNIGGIISIVIAGNLKDSFTCFGGPCYLFVYVFLGLSTALVIISSVLFIAFSNSFIRAPLTQNILLEAVKCFLVALKNKRNIQKKVSNEERKSILDYALPEYDERFVADLKQSLRVASLLFIGIPYWTCYQTIFSSWSRQYSFVDERIAGVTITFIMYIILDPIIIVISIFMQNNYIIPFLSKFTKVTPLKKMALGGLFAALSFAFVVGVEQKIIQDQLAPLKEGARIVTWKQSSLPQNCQLHLEKDGRTLPISLFDNGKPIDIVPNSYKGLYICTFPQKVIELSNPINIQEGLNYLFIYLDSGNITVKPISIQYQRLENTKAEVTMVSCRTTNITKLVLTLAGIQSSEKVVRLENCLDSCEVAVNLNEKSGARVVYFDDYDCSGGFNGPSSSFQEIVAVPGYFISAVYMWPQNIAFGLSESLLAVGALEFAYTQTNTSMKAFMQALWLLTAAMGNVLGFLLNQAGMSPLFSQSVYGGIMLVFTMIFIVASWRYEYVNIEEEGSSDHE